jgi:hypothetical protein
MAKRSGPTPTPAPPEEGPPASRPTGPSGPNPVSGAPSGHVPIQVRPAPGYSSGYPKEIQGQETFA